MFDNSCFDSNFDNNSYYRCATPDFSPHHINNMDNPNMICLNFRKTDIDKYYEKYEINNASLDDSQVKILKNFSSKLDFYVASTREYIKHLAKYVYLTDKYENIVFDFINHEKNDIDLTCIIISSFLLNKLHIIDYTINNTNYNLSKIIYLTSICCTGYEISFLTIAATTNIENCRYILSHLKTPNDNIDFLIVCDMDIFNLLYSKEYIPTIEKNFNRFKTANNLIAKINIFLSDGFNFNNTFIGNIMNIFEKNMNDDFFQILMENFFYNQENINNFFNGICQWKNVDLFKFLINKNLKPDFIKTENVYDFSIFKCCLENNLFDYSNTVVKPEHSHLINIMNNNPDFYFNYFINLVEKNEKKRYEYEAYFCNKYIN